jgi:serine phosphatase RsbU (regulator of sigma subunit)/catechol 2,3-dioxygenase-like lactoylglutathione lyase family enzyme
MNNPSAPDRGAGARDRHGAESLRSHLQLNFVTVWVRDQERSRRFFVDQLGFQVAVDSEVPGVGRWIIATPPNGLPGIALVVPLEGSEGAGRIGQNTGVCFLTEDVRALFEEWSKHGVRFALPPMEPPWGRGQARYAVFEDVDGNRFSLIEIDDATRALEAERRAHAARLEAERRAAHDLAIANEVQSRLFPQRHPPLHTLSYAGACFPARAVGGDYYDFLDLGKGRLGLVVGDIAGKGLAAALLMANLQANLRSQCAMAWEQPQRFLRSVNQLFCENSADRDYATIFFAEYDDHTRRLRYANCGHPPAFLLRQDGSPEPLESTSTVIGLFKQWDCAIEERQLYPGEVLVLYTDGATESANRAGEEFGEARLLDVLTSHRELSSPELLAAVMGQVRQFSGADVNARAHEQADDITIIVARCT